MHEDVQLFRSDRTVMLTHHQAIRCTRVLEDFEMKTKHTFIDENSYLVVYFNGSPNLFD